MDLIFRDHRRVVYLSSVLTLRPVCGFCPGPRPGPRSSTVTTTNWSVEPLDDSHTDTGADGPVRGHTPLLLFPKRTNYPFGHHTCD